MRTAHTFDREFVRGTNLKLVDPLKQTKLFEEKEFRPSTQNEESSKNVRQMDTNLSFHVPSEIVFDTKHQFAVLKRLSVCGKKCVSGETLVMEKIDDNGLYVQGVRAQCSSAACSTLQNLLRHATAIKGLVSCRPGERGGRRLWAGSPGS